MKEKQSILEQIEEFLNYLANKEGDENARKDENLIKKFGEERYRRIYSLIGGKYTGGLPKKEGDKRYNIFYINDAGLKFLEERQEKRNQERRLDSQIYLTGALFTIAFLQATISIIYNYFDLQIRQSPDSNIFLFGSVIVTVSFFIIFMYNVRKKR